MNGWSNPFLQQLENGLFRRRRLVIWIFALLTLGMGWYSLQTRIDAGFAKQLPLQHEYIKTFLEYSDQFGGANRVLVAMHAGRGDIFQVQFLDLLAELTDAVFYLPGVDRAQVTSILTPNVRFIEVVEDGFAGGNVFPADFDGSDRAMAVLRENIVKSGRLGQLVSEDFRSALVAAQLQDIDPATGERLDYIEVAKRLESIRVRFEEKGENLGVSLHIIGFAKVVGDVAQGARNVVAFFFFSLIVTAVFVRYYAQSFRLALLPILTSIVSVVWQLGLLSLLGYGIDPLSILVPFLIFAIGVSHGVQMVRCFRTEFFKGENSLHAARESFRQLLGPGSAALVTDTLGFVTILIIPIGIIRELAIAASLGVATILFTNLLLLPLLLSYVQLQPGLRARVAARRARTDRFWTHMAHSGRRIPSLVILGSGLALFLVGFQFASRVAVGDLDEGVPELRESSRYNQDSRFITSNFSIGVDIITVIVETVPDGVIDFAVMSHIDRFMWHMRNVPGVQSVVGLPEVAKVFNAGWNEGNPKWRILPSHPQVLGQAISPVETASGLINEDGSVVPVIIYLKDHRAGTISRIIDAVKEFRETYEAENVNYRLATGNVGVMGATNEVVSASQFPILAYVFIAVILLCLITFRSLASAVCIVVPLALVSVLAYALMYFLDIGLKVSTLPVAALGVGIGVDYGIYLYSRLQKQLQAGDPFLVASENALRLTGSAVVFTGLTLGVGVSTWIFSDLKFQADMGILLTFMFLLNMMAAIIGVPALARWFHRS